MPIKEITRDIFRQVNTWVKVKDEKAWQAARAANTIEGSSNLRYTVDGEPVVFDLQPGWDTEDGHIELNTSQKIFDELETSGINFTQPPVLDTSS